MKRILIGDDHAVVRRGLKQILTDEFKNLQVGEAADAAEVLKLARSQSWDLLILDINLPGRSGLEVLNELQAGRGKFPVLMLSMHPEDQFAIRALKAGAAGYLTKESASDELLKAVNKILSGGKYVSPTLAEKLAMNLEQDYASATHESLSDREFQVLRLIASGKTVGQIADELSLSVKTISTYRARILEKLNLTTNAELTKYGIQNRLV
ncbi:MAG TPA: response regulator transcription factor [Bacteroidota bacterium]|jgi:DNA-binding NarL/FixJ family response regulator|nr:response regulator transcription factor [Bacteroidota bacterium]